MGNLVSLDSAQLITTLCFVVGQRPELKQHLLAYWGMNWQEGVADEVEEPRAKDAPQGTLRPSQTIQRLQLCSSERVGAIVECLSPSLGERDVFHALFEKIKSCLAAVAEVEEIILAGSVAKGTAMLNVSDLDIVVSLKNYDLAEHTQHLGRIVKRMHSITKKLHARRMYGFTLRVHPAADIAALHLRNPPE